MDKDVILIGGGGHCKSVVDVLEQIGYNIVGIIDQPSELGKEILSYKIIGNDNDIPLYCKKHKFVITIGQIMSPNARIRIYNRIKEYGGELLTVVSPLAHISKYATIGEGTIIMNGATVNADTSIGKCCIINTTANIEHDVVVGDFCHISTGAMINGGCTIGNNTFIGSQSVVVNGKSIAEDSVIGAGSVVNKDIIDKGTYAGNPVKKIKTSL